MKTFVILTPNDNSRKTKLESQLFTQKLELGKDIQVFDAIMDYGTPAVGISKSHKSIVQKAKDNNWSEVTIIEDDIIFLVKNSFEIFCNIYKQLPKDTDLFFGNVYDGEIGERFFAYAELTGRVSGLNLYCIKQKFYNTFLSADPAMNIDFWLSTLANPLPKMYVCWPFVALQRDGEYSYNLRGVSSHNYKLEERYVLMKDKQSPFKNK